jgi:membrane protease subunit HflK
MSSDPQPDRTPADTTPKPAAPAAPTPALGPAPRPVEDAGAQALADALRSSFHIVRFLMVALVAAFFISGVFTVEPNQVVVLLRFGAPVGHGSDRLLQPGLHWKLPYPIDEVVAIPVGESRSITSTAGWYRLSAEEEIAGSRDPNMASPTIFPGTDGYTLTGDRNIIHARATLTYRISDPIAYAFEFANVTNLLQSILDNALFHASARFNADDALYLRRAAFQEAVMARVNQSIDRLQLGISVEPREVRVEPPLYVLSAFTGVLEAQQRGDTRVREAEAYARNATNQAIGEASVTRQTALSLSNTLVQTVRTESTNFLGLLPGYLRDTNLLQQRLLAETAERIFTNAQFKLFLPNRADGQSREVRLLLNKEIEAPTKIGTNVSR